MLNQGWGKWNFSCSRWVCPWKKEPSLNTVLTFPWWSESKPDLAEAGRSVGLPPTEPLSFPQGRPFLNPLGGLSFPQQGSFQNPCLKSFCWPKACHLENHSPCGLLMSQALSLFSFWEMMESTHGGVFGDLRVGGSLVSAPLKSSFQETTPSQESGLF